MRRAALLAVAALFAGGAARACYVAPRSLAIPGSVTEAAGVPSAAWFEFPTDIYGHGIMGRVPDAEMLTVEMEPPGGMCGTMSAEAGQAHVFEDIAPRLADFDDDGVAEAVAVRSSLTRGAQLAVYGIRGTDLRLLAATPYIGQRNRWLAPAAIGDLDGDGQVEIAYVDRPHLAKVLRVVRLEGDRLVEVAATSGVTNHRIGDETIWGGLRACDGGPEVVLASGDLSRLLALRFDGAAFTARDLGPWSMDATEAALRCG